MSWPIKKLGEIEDAGVIKLGRGNIISKKDIEQISGDYPIYSSSQQNEGEFGRYGKYMFDEELITWSVDGGGQFFYRPKHKYSVTNVCGWLRVLQPKVLSCQFLYFTLYYSHKKLNFDYTFKAHPSVIRKMYKISIPPLEIQHQIVKRLNVIRKVQDLNNKQIALADELFQSLLNEELNSEEEWKTKRFEEISSFQYGYTASAQETGKYRFIRITDIDDSGEIRDGDKKFIEGPEEELNSYFIQYGDLLVARTGATFGKILFFNLREKSIFASYLIRFNIDKKLVNPMYIWLFSRTKEYWKQAMNLMTGSGQPQFNANKIKRIKIHLPPLETQRQIVEKLQVVQIYKKKLLEQRLKLRELFKSVLHKAMTGELIK